MTAIVIIAILLAVICGLLCLSLSFHISYDENARVKVYYGFLSYLIYPKKEKPKKEKTKDKKQVPKSAHVKKEQEKKSFSETVNSVLDMIKSIIGPSRKLLKHIRIKKLDVLVIVGDEDAAQTAQKYGITSSAVYGTVVGLKSMIDIQVKSLYVGYDFNSIEDIYKVSLKVKIRGFFVIAASFGMIKNLLVNTLKNDKKIKNVGEEENKK